jgi:hypothetical protein
MLVDLGGGQTGITLTDTTQDGRGLVYETNWICSQATNVHYDCFNVVFIVADDFYVAPIKYDDEDGKIYKLVGGKVVAVELTPELLQRAVFFR